MADYIGVTSTSSVWPTLSDNCVNLFFVSFQKAVETNLSLLWLRSHQLLLCFGENFEFKNDLFCLSSTTNLPVAPVGPPAGPVGPIGPTVVHINRNVDDF